MTYSINLHFMTYESQEVIWSLVNHFEMNILTVCWDYCLYRSANKTLQDHNANLSFQNGVYLTAV